MFLSSGEFLPLVIALACFLIPVVTLLIIAMVKQIIKRLPEKEPTLPKPKNAKKPKKGTEEVVEVPEAPKKVYYLDFFGGSDNVVAATKNMTRVTIEVVDLEKVNFDQLRKLGIGVLITGNIIKCSSEEFAKQIGE